MISLNPIWPALGRCFAAASGGFIALVSLLHHVPVWVASLRGGLTWLAITLVVRIGLRALEATFAADAARAAAVKTSGAASSASAKATKS